MEEVKALTTLIGNLPNSVGITVGVVLLYFNLKEMRRDIADEKKKGRKRDDRLDGHDDELKINHIKLATIETDISHLKRSKEASRRS